MTASAVWQGSNLNIKTPPSVPINSPQIPSKTVQQQKSTKSRNSKSNNASFPKEPQSRGNSRSSHNNASGSKGDQIESRNGFHLAPKDQEGKKSNSWHSKNWENNSNDNVKRSKENLNNSNNDSSISNNAQKSLNQERGKSESIAIPSGRTRSDSKSTPYLHPNHPDRSQSGTTPPSYSSNPPSNTTSSKEKPDSVRENDTSKESASVPHQKEVHHEKKNHKKGKGNSSQQSSTSQPTAHSSNQYFNNHGSHKNGGNAFSNEWVYPIIDKIPSSNCKELSPHPEIFDLEGARGTLAPDQVNRLKLLLDEECNIVSKDKLLKITGVTPFKLISKLISRLAMSEIFVLDSGIRLVGSGAAHVLVESQSSIDVPKEDLVEGTPPPFLESSHLINDIDFCFYVPEGTEFYKILQIQEHVIIEFLEENQHTRKYSLRDIYTQFFLDSVKVESESPKEGWSLITIGEQGQRTIDIKFVVKSKRSWVFSADSFEIILDPFFHPVIACYKSVVKFVKRTAWMDALKEAASSIKYARESISNEDVVKVESLYADYVEALDHLRNKLLFTKRPEEIRRGIFRYCHELAKGKAPTESERVKLDKIFVDSFLSEKNSKF